MNYGIIAAGKGERLATEGILLPKPLVAPDGEPLIDRLMRIMSLPRGAAAMTCLSIIVREQEIAGHVQTACEHTGIGQLTRVIVKATADSMLSFAEVTAGFDSDFIVTTVDTVFASDELVRLAHRCRRLYGSYRLCRRRETTLGQHRRRRDDHRLHRHAAARFALRLGRSVLPAGKSPEVPGRMPRRRHHAHAPFPARSSRAA